MKLNDISIRALKAPATGAEIHYDDDLAGFGVRVSKGGTKSYVLTHGPRRTRETIGRVGIISLKDARKRAKELLAEYTLGKHKSAAKAWSAAVDEYLKEIQQKRREQTYKSYKRHLKKHFKFGDTRMNDISPHEFEDIFRKLKDRPAELHHAFINVRAFVKRAFTELVTPTKQTTEGLSALGLSVDQVQKLLPTPIELLRTLQEHMESIQDPVQRASALSQVFGQISGPAMSALLNEGVDAIDGYKTALQAAGGATDDAAQRLTNAANPLQLLQNELHDMSIQIGQALQPALQALAADLKPVIDGISGFVQAHPQLTAAILLITLGFAGLLAVLLPIALALPGLVLLFSGLATVFAFVASGPGIAIIAAIAGIGVTIYSIMGIVDIFKNDWTDTWLGIQLIVADTVNNVIGMTETMVNFIIDGVNLAIKAINTVIAQIQKIPGIGSHVSKIGTLSDVSFDRIDTEAIVSSTINKPAAQGSTNITITGNTLLSSDVATQIGDMIMGKLKLSNAV